MGIQYASAPAAAKAMSPVVAMPAAKDKLAASNDRSAGPHEDPISDIRRHTPRKCARPCCGEWSAPRVMIIPEPMPLPKPMASEASNSVVKPDVKGIHSIAYP